MYIFKQWLPFNCKRNIYFALIYSKLVYGIEVYGSATKSNLDPLIIKCNRLLRVLQNKPRKTRVIDLYDFYNTLPVNLLFKLFIMKIMHRRVYDSNNILLVICKLFYPGTSIHTHNTRNKNNFILQNNIPSKSFSFYGPSMWNKLPSNIQSMISITTLLKYYKNFLLKE